MKGWLFDVYPTGEDQIAVCFKTDNGELRIFKDGYIPNIYVYGGRGDLENLESELEKDTLVKSCSFEEKRVKLRDLEKKKALKIECGSMNKVPRLVQKIAHLGEHRKYDLYNVDLSYAQAYLQENNLFPLARSKLSDISNLQFELIDSAESSEYILPPLKFVKLSVKSEKPRPRSGFRDPISEVRLSFEDENISIEGRNEKENILRLVSVIREEDPDIIFTRGGDSWDMPYLAKRAEINEVSDRLVLGRESLPYEGRGEGGISYFSYGRVYYRPPSHYLKGRIHVDTQNSFIYRECGFQGLVELSRMTRTPLQKTARSSIGSAMTNLQIHWALKNDVLIPLRKSDPEDFKSSLKLFEADRGGYIYEPEIGIHENVGEIDFSSFYPTMMKKYNLSPETVLCDCCPNSGERVPELGYNICEKRKGLIPQVLEPVLEKRREYKQLAKETESEEKRRIYNNRQNALKWILVTCFGYLGYRNARFGKIEAHEAVTAFARENLKKASRIAENENFEVVHGIVDSLWVKKPELKYSELETLCSRIKEETSLPISPEGKYMWIVFPPSKEGENLPVMNRYYGVLETGELKTRGIATRRSDTPKAVSEAQEEMLESLAGAEDEKEFKDRIQDVLKVVKEYISQIKEKKIQIDKLAVKKKLSRDPDSYEIDARSAIAAKQLKRAGIKLHPGQQVEYIVTNADAKRPRLRVRPVQLLDGKSKYDKEWYVDKLLDATEEILLPFGFSKNKIKSKVVRKGKQEKLR